MRLAPLLALTIALTTHAFAEGERQYVALTDSGQGVILWTDRLAATKCARATLRGTERDQRELCETARGNEAQGGGCSTREPRWSDSIRGRVATWYRCASSAARSPAGLATSRGAP